MSEVIDMALMEADNLLNSYRALRRFKWHSDVYFQWQAMICVLSELIARPVGEQKTEAWTQIQDVFKNHPDFLRDSKKPLHATYLVPIRMPLRIILSL